MDFPMHYPYAYPTWGFTMPEKYKNTIIDRTKQGRYFLDLIQHFTKGEQEKIIQFMVYPSGQIAIERVDDYWVEEFGFVPKSWEAS